MPDASYHACFKVPLGKDRQKECNDIKKEPCGPFKKYFSDT